jgi:hypothetical protein
MESMVINYQTIKYQPVVYMARDEMILMRATSLSMGRVMDLPASKSLSPSTE